MKRSVNFAGSLATSKRRAHPTQAVSALVRRYVGAAIQKGLRALHAKGGER